MRDYKQAAAPIVRSNRWFREIIESAGESEQAILVVREKDAASIATALRNAYQAGRKDLRLTIQQIHAPAGPDTWNPRYCTADNETWPCKTIQAL